MISSKHSALCVLALAVAPLGCGKSGAPPVAGSEAVDNSFRLQKPEGGPAPALRAPKPELVTLANGLSVLVVEDRRLPLVAVQLVMRGGSSADPTGLPGTTGFLAEVLEAGTKTRSAQQIADEVETLGGSVDVGADVDSLAAGMFVMTRHFDAVFDVLADIVQNPAFDAAEIERVRKRRIAELEELQDDPKGTAQRVFASAVFGSHPYGHTVLGSRAALEKLSAADLKKQFASVVGPQGAAIVLVGDIDKAGAIAAVEKRFGAWKTAAKAPAPPSAATAAGPVLWLVDKPGAPQSELRLGHVAVERNHPDYFPLVLCNAILGGMFSSRINMNLREDKGWTYGARSSFDFRRSRGPFAVGTAVRTNVTAEAVREVLKEIEGIRTANVTDEELSFAKASFTLSLPGMFESLRSTADSVARLHLYELPLDYFQVLPEKLAAVGIADVRRVAEQHLKPEALSIVVVGDRKMVENALADLGRGKPEVRSADGEKL